MSDTIDPELLTIAQRSKTLVDYARRAEAWASVLAKPPSDFDMAQAVDHVWAERDGLPMVVMVGHVRRLIVDARRERLARKHRLRNESTKQEKQWATKQRTRKAAAR